MKMSLIQQGGWGGGSQISTLSLNLTCEFQPKGGVGQRI